MKVTRLLLNAFTTLILLLLISGTAYANRIVDQLFIEMGLEENASTSSEPAEKPEAFTSSLQATKNVLDNMAKASPVAITPHLLVNTLIHFIVNKEERAKFLQPGSSLYETRDDLLREVGIRYSSGSESGQGQVFLGRNTNEEKDISDMVKLAWFYRSSQIPDHIKVNNIIGKTAISKVEIAEIFQKSFGEIIPEGESDPLTVLAKTYPAIIDFLAAVHMARPEFPVHDLLVFLSLGVKGDLYQADYHLPEAATAATAFFRPASSSTLNITLFFWGILGQPENFLCSTSTLPLQKHGKELLKIMGAIFDLTNPPAKATRKFYPSGSAELLLLQCIHNFSSTHYAKYAANFLDRNLLLLTHEGINTTNQLSLAFFLESNKEKWQLAYYQADDDAPIQQLADTIQSLVSKDSGDGNSASVHHLFPGATASLLAIGKMPFSVDTITAALNGKTWLTPRMLTQYLESSDGSAPVKMADILHHLPGYSQYHSREAGFDQYLLKYVFRIAGFMFDDSIEFQNPRLQTGQVRERKQIEFVLPSDPSSFLYDHAKLYFPTAQGKDAPKENGFWQGGVKLSTPMYATGNFSEVPPIHHLERKDGDFVWLLSVKTQGMCLPWAGGTRYCVKLYAEDFTDGIPSHPEYNSTRLTSHGQAVYLNGEMTAVDEHTCDPLRSGMVRPGGLPLPSSNSDDEVGAIIKNTLKNQ